MHPARIAELLAPFLVPPPLSSVARHSSERSDQKAILSPLQLQKISTYIDILLRWNARMNLTAVRDPEEIVTRHFGESLFAARRLFPRSAQVGTDAPESPPRAEWRGPAVQSSASDGSVPRSTAEEHRTSLTVEEHRGRAALQGRVSEEREVGALDPGVSSLQPVLGAAAERRKSAAHGASRGFVGAPEQAAEQRKKITVADLGSGAGFPGIPIKLWAPEISLTLIESNHKKATFLREIARALALTDIDIQIARAESLLERAFDLVTLRAVERFETVLPTAAGLVVPRGRLALLIGNAQLPAASSLLPTLSWSDPVPIPASRSRLLAIATKSGSKDAGKAESIQ